MPRLLFHKNRLLKEPIELEGEPGDRILDIAQDKGLPVGANCGGVGGCSTCHVYVVQGEESLTDLTDKEDRRLDKAFDVRMESRLACQARLGDEDIEIRITEESLRAFLNENPKVRDHFEATGELLFIPHHH